MSDLFTISGLCGVKIAMEDTMHTCAGKVNVVVDNKHMSGFVMNERRTRWNVVLMNNREVTLKRVKWNDKGGYSYDANIGRSNDGLVRVAEYSPICMKFVEGCQNNWQTMLCRCAFRKKHLVQQLTS